MKPKQDHFLALFVNLDAPKIEQFATYLGGFFGPDHQVMQLLRLVRETKESKSNLEEGHYQRRLSAGKQKELKANHVSKLFSNLNIHLKSFLLLDYLESNEIERELLFAQTMLHQAQKHAFEKHLKKAQNKIMEEPMGLGRYMLSFQVNLLHYFSPIVYKKGFRVELIQKVIEELDEFYVSAKLKLAVELYTRQAIFQEPIVPNPFVPFLRQPFLYSGQKLSQLYRKVYTLLVEKGENCLEDMIQLWEGEISKLGDNDEQAYLLTLLMNINAIAINQGKPNAYHTQHKLLSIGIQSGIITPHGVISPERLMSLVNAACEIAEVAKAQQYINQWKDLIRPVQFTDEILLLASTRIDFANKQFSKVVKRLQKQKYEHPYCEYWYKCLMIRSKYELKKFDEAYDLCDHFLRNFRRRKSKNSPESKVKLLGKFIEQSTKAFLNTVMKMTNCTKFSEEFKKEIESKEMAYKSWVLEKLNEDRRL